MPIEIAWTVAPILIVFLLALILIRTEFEVRVNPDTPPPGSKPLYVTVIGHQWWWEYVYDKYDGAGPGHHHGQRAARTGRRGRRAAAGVPDLKSADVCHSFWVPRLAGKTDLIPAHESPVVPDEPAGPVPRPVRRVLRHAARPHAPAGQRQLPRGVPELAGRSEEAGRGRCGRPRGPTCSWRSRASTATACAARPPRAPMPRT